jgi:hypothetical protein
MVKRTVVRGAQRHPLALLDTVYRQEGDVKGTVGMRSRK